MRICVIVPTVNRFEKWPLYEDAIKSLHVSPSLFPNAEVDVIVIDESPGPAREFNRDTVANAEFYGAAERVAWFEGLGLGDSDLGEVIPLRSHAETSFGLLLAYERDCYDAVFFVDDDTSPVHKSFFTRHMEQLGVLESSELSLEAYGSKWLKTVLDDYYPRGFPYACRGRSEFVPHKVETVGNVLNQGLWTGVPDMNAVDLLSRGSLDGRLQGYYLHPIIVNRVVPKGLYATVCSMNLAFKPEIIPAFYQLPLGPETGWKIHRFDDIWSGLFLKKILDHLGKSMSFGYPLCYHDKTPRDIWKDVRLELEGMVINEKLWQVVDGFELTGSDYLECYEELATKLFHSAYQFHMPDFIRYMAKKMSEWTALIRRL